MLGWNILERNFTTGGLLGYSSLNSRVSLNVPSLTMQIRMIRTYTRYRQALTREWIWHLELRGLHYNLDRINRRLEHVMKVLGLTLC